ncbi:hypothetical protein FOTG_17371 [Fusarium oxysporum f. sp. vasinfectum 25433]|uniref:Uncharacterized protein n=1 Tax=Fusarium oxysporum f. sp. vasinfectum 25433 TaxID=1089449 RepID=X0KKY4_FUSOX|nr:hypothetical protein FOTG_17371 [Fusarium oxysporum f. sp. vasinfectum 25433]
MEQPGRRDLTDPSPPSPLRRILSLLSGRTFYSGYEIKRRNRAAALRSSASAASGNHRSRFTTCTKFERRHQIPGFSGCMRALGPVLRRHTETWPINCSFQDEMIRSAMCCSWCMLGCAMKRMDHG